MDDGRQMERQPEGGPVDNLIQPFMIDQTSIRGRQVRLGKAIDEILGAHDYPEPVAALLGETVALAAILADALKFDGIFTLQTKGEGPVRLMVADVTTDGALRGYAQVDTEAVAALGDVGGHPVQRLLGPGYLAFTVDQGPDTERYQGIVELVGGTLVECVHHYFQQSQQFDAAVTVAVRRHADGWRAGGLMLQRVPDEGGVMAARAGVTYEHRDMAEPDDTWVRALTLMATASPDELADPGIAPNDLLFRLFHEDGVRVYEPQPLAARCRCSADRVAGFLATMPDTELEEYMIDGEVEITCEFCTRSYRYDEAALTALKGK